MLNSKLIAALFISGCLVIGCQNTNDNGALPQGTVSVGNKGAARIGQDVTITADSIMDSRCPKNVQCVWAGNARVAFILSDNTASQKDTLCIGDCSSKLGFNGSVDTLTLSSNRYQVTLLDVTPYPTTNATAKPEAVFKVVKL